MEKVIVKVVIKLIALLTPAEVGQVWKVLLEKQEEQTAKHMAEKYMSFWHQPINNSEGDAALKQYAERILPGVNLAEINRINLIRALANKANRFRSEAQAVTVLEVMLQQHDCELRHLRSLRRKADRS